MLGGYEEIRRVYVPLYLRAERYRQLHAALSVKEQALLFSQQYSAHCVNCWYLQGAGRL